MKVEATFCKIIDLIYFRPKQPKQILQTIELIYTCTNLHKTNVLPMSAVSMTYQRYFLNLIDTFINIYTTMFQISS